MKPHPNSTAARKWKRTSWSSKRNLWAEAAEARKLDNHIRAQALTRAAARTTTRTEIHC